MFNESFVLCYIFENNLGPIRAGYKVRVWLSQPLVDGHWPGAFLLGWLLFCAYQLDLQIENCARFAVNFN